MNSLKKLLLIAALALFASAAQADHSVRFQGSLLIQQDGYQIFLGAPLNHYSGGYTYRTPRFIAPNHRKHRRFSRGRHRIRDPLLHDFRRFRRPHRSERHFKRFNRSERHFNRFNRSDRHFNRQLRSDRHLRRQH